MLFKVGVSGFVAIGFSASMKECWVELLSFLFSFLIMRGDSSFTTAGEMQEFRSLFFLYKQSPWIEVARLVLSSMNYSLITERWSFDSSSCITVAEVSFFSTTKSASVWTCYALFSLSESVLDLSCDYLSSYAWHFFISVCMLRAFMYSEKFTGRTPS